MGYIIKESSLLFNSDDSVERNIKEEKYLDYINNHIKNVQLAYNKYFLPLLSEDDSNYEDIENKLPSDVSLKEAIIEANESIKSHDQSKFSEDEFNGYRAKYYPTSVEEQDEEFVKLIEVSAEKAWVHHYKNNPHHPEYWYNEDTKQSLAMDLKYIIEMICDWSSFYLDEVRRDLDDNGMNSVIDWWERDPSGKEEKEKIMNPDSFKIAEILLYSIIK